ncbi:hypothetical protein ACLOJK_030304 [Asimina triloba]
MQSLQSSVGSKSSNYSRILHLPASYHHQDESITTLRSSWIRRLCQQVPSSQPPAPTLLPSACSVPSGDDDSGGNGDRPKGNMNPSITLGHHNTICTVESRTRTSKSNLQTEFFASHRLNFHRGKASVEEPRTPLSFPSFGPFKVGCQSSHVPPPLPAPARPYSPSSSLDRHTLPGFDHLNLECKEADGDQASNHRRRDHRAAIKNFDRIGSFGFDAKDSLTDFVQLDFTSYGNSQGEVGFPFRKRTEEEDKMKGGVRTQRGWLLEEHDFDFVNDGGGRGMRSFQKRMAGDDLPSRFHISPFYQLHPPPKSLQDSIAEEHDQQRKRWVGESSGTIMESDWLSSGSLKHLPSKRNSSRFSAKSTPLLGQHDLMIYDAPVQRMFEQHHPVDPWRSSEEPHGIKYISRNRSNAYHATCTDNHAACRTIQAWMLPYLVTSGVDLGKVATLVMISSDVDPPPMHRSTILHRPERPDPACPDETEEPFSYWNMGRMKRSNAASSVFPAFPVLTSSSRKRNPVAEDFIYVKSRRLGVED